MSFLSSCIVFVTLVYLASAQHFFEYEVPAGLPGCLEAKRVAESTVRLLGRFVPECDELGNYKPLQCWPSTGLCRCVQPNGLPITNLSRKLKDCACVLQVEGLPRLPGSFVPTCSEDGTFSRVQCHYSAGLCWCVDKDGQQTSEKRRGHPDC